MIIEIKKKKHCIKCALRSSPPYKNVRFGVQKCALRLFHSCPNETTKSTFNFYNLFPAVNLIPNMVNVLFIVHISRFPPSRLAPKNMLEKWTNICSVGGLQIRWTGCLSTEDGSVQLI